MKRLAWLLILMAACVPLATPQAPPSHLEVTSIDVTGPMPQWINSSTSDSRIQTTITNQGDTTTAYTLHYHWESGGDWTPLNGDEEASTDVTREPIPPGATVVHEADWLVQDHQRGDGAIVAEVRPVGDDTGGHVLTLPIHVAVRALSVAWLTTEEEIRPDETRRLPFEVHNDGSIREDLSVNVVQDGALLHQELLTADLHLAPGESKRGYLEVHSPFGQPADRTAVFNLHVAPDDGQLQQDASISVQTTDQAYSDDAFRANLQATAPAHGAVDAQGKTIRLVLSNIGQDHDVYHLKATGSDDCTADIPPTWDVAVTPTSVHLLPGETVDVLVHVVPGANVTSGSPLDLTTCALSGHGFPEAAHATASLWRSGPRFTVEIQKPLADAYVETSQTHHVAIRNTGTASSNGTLELAWRLGGHANTTLLDVPAIPPGGSMEQTWIIDWPSDGGPAEMMAQWSAPGVRSANDATTLFVRSPWLSMDTPDAVPARPGQALSLMLPPHAFQVTQHGNASEVITLRAATTHGEIEFAEAPDITIAAGQTRSVPLIVHLPAQIHADTVNVALTASLPDKGTLTRAIELPVQDANRPDIQITQAPTNWDPRQPVSIRGFATDDTGINATWVTVEGPEGAQNHTVRLHPTGTWATTLDLSPGRYEITAHATDQHGRIGVSQPHEIVVANYPVPIIESATVQVSANNTWAVNVTASDALGIVQVKILDGGTPIANQSSNQTRVQAVLPLPTLAAGQHNLTIIVTSATGQHNTTTLELFQPEPPDVPTEAPSREAPGIGWMPMLAAGAVVAGVMRRGRL